MQILEQTWNFDFFFSNLFTIFETVYQISRRNKSKQWFCEHLEVFEILTQGLLQTSEFKYSKNEIAL